MLYSFCRNYDANQLWTTKFNSRNEVWVTQNESLFLTSDTNHLGNEMYPSASHKHTRIYKHTTSKPT